jgi:hypothetical protein
MGGSTSALHGLQNIIRDSWSIISNRQHHFGAPVFYGYNCATAWCVTMCVTNKVRQEAFNVEIYYLNKHGSVSLLNTQFLSTKLMHIPTIHPPHYLSYVARGVHCGSRTRRSLHEKSLKVRYFTLQ